MVVTLQIPEAREVFSLYDRTGRGVIAAANVGTLVRSLGANPTEAELDEVVAAVDLSGSGQITFPEFLTVMQNFVTSRTRPEDTPGEMVEAFSVFDAEGTGFVTVKEMRHILGHLGEKIDPHEVEALLKSMPSDWQGKVAYAEFTENLFAKKD
eukprot:TRINITY_DN22929_c0_g1_i3.p2 TRINITY_DN22929_c0_g1~~TRINITY_DN22929_c0_g1_i3.p2  ORF type:complete len:153 (+),score=42.49 TRINITY_DN22929_c0_g1_i3:218-676(+)